ncbi:hypothetical protein RM553_08270 [Zunongwangia sp. F363]|uniref:HEAT repeat domain-containing protein n=1 Tax=Autumnicola tepida TaxID=3075595 RepID=A0ABU3C959_9FLAO|nr:hypothetical protein [Zunongwangia sp. F363]MDT0642823.1 hypothetical protein [Zunongwangia sp. F363]
MEEFIEHIIQNGELILKINLIFTMVFFLITLFFISSILFLRYQKILKEKKLKKLNEALSNFINIYLFDESLSPNDIKTFQSQNLKSAFEQKIAIKTLLVFEENFKGSTNTMICDLFFMWELDKLTERDLKSGIWYKIARAIYVSSELRLIDFKELVQSHLNSEREEVRQQAIFYLITISEEKPLEFLDLIKTPITLWEQIYIEECLKTKYSGPIPDFSIWLHHTLTSVQLFSMKMISEYNQYENIDKMVPFLLSEKEELKNAAIEYLAQLEYSELLDYCKETFNSQTPNTKKVIIKILQRIGNTDDFLKFENRIPAHDWMNLQVFNNLKSNFIEESNSVTV